MQTMNDNELVLHQRPQKYIYDVIHRQYTIWCPSLLCIINTPEFQRLRFVKQLAACHWVFPSATHTRFEHSIGVGFLAEKWLRALQHNQPELNITSLCILSFKLAGLCHDLGHGPLSHGFDTFLTKHLPSSLQYIAQHEQRSVIMLRYIVDKYDIELPEGVVDMACELILPVQHHLPKWQYQIIANDVDGIDVDKMDYLLRDTHNTGVMCHDVDINRFIDYARVLPNTDNEEVLCYPEKLAHDIHQLFLTRHRLHCTVYQHPVVRSFEMMYKDVLVLMKDAIINTIHNTPDISWMLNWTDYMFSTFYVKQMTSEMSNEQMQAASHILEDMCIRAQPHQVVHLLVPQSLQMTPETEKDILQQCSQYVGNVHTFHKHWRLDIVHIGYQNNPLFKVWFYDKTHKHVHTLDVDRTSTMFPIHAKDVYLNLYVNDKIMKQHVTTQGLKTILNRFINVS